MIDMSKQYRTRDGREVRIYAVDGAKDYPVHGAFLTEEKEWFDKAWDDHGHVIAGRTNARPNDLVEVKAEVWVWQFGNGETCGKHHDTREECEASLRAESGRAVRFVQEDESWT
jgi:hypothetical protein